MDPWENPDLHVSFIPGPFIPTLRFFYLFLKFSLLRRDTVEGRIMSYSGANRAQRISVLGPNVPSQNSDPLGVFDLCPDVKAQGKHP